MRVCVRAFAYVAGRRQGHANDFLEKLTVSRQSRDPVAKLHLLGGLRTLKSFTVKPDVLFRATLQTSAAMLVF